MKAGLYQFWKQLKANGKTSLSWMQFYKHGEWKGKQPDKRWKKK